MTMAGVFGRMRALMIAFVRTILKYVMNAMVNTFARVRGFYFPPIPWYRKLEFLLGRYELETTRFFRREIREGMGVVDIGANIGYFTRIFSRLVGARGVVYAFEPDEENWHYLEANTRGLSNVRLIKKAVSNKTGKIDFYHVTGNIGIHSILEVPAAEHRTVDSITLDDFMATEKVSQLHVIKIDVEGAEGLVLEGMKNLLLKKPIVVFEYTPETSRSVLEHVKQNHHLYSISVHGTLDSLDKASYRVGKGLRQYANIVLSD